MHQSYCERNKVIFEFSSHLAPTVGDDQRFFVCD